MKIQYQYLAPNADKPDTVSISDAHYEIKQGEPIPQRGDYVMLQLCYPENVKGNFKHLEVIAKHFFYSNNKQQNDMIIIVKDAPNLPEINFRE